MTREKKRKRESRSEMKQKEKSKKKALYHLYDDFFIFKQIKADVDALNTLNDMTYDETIQFFELSHD